MKHLDRWLMISLTIAFVGFVAGLIGLGGYGRGNALLLPVSITLSVIWLLMAVSAVIVHHRRGLWLLVGAPIALFWPGVVVLFAQAMDHCQIAGGCVP